MPRERLVQEGAAYLSNQELLAILLRTGTTNESVLQLANRLLVEFDGIMMLKEASLEELQAIKGIGQVKAVELRAALELGKRIHTTQQGERYSIKTPEDASDYVMEEMRFLTQEHFVAIYLNTKNQVLHKKTLFIGSLNASIVHPREVFKEALRRSAASIVCLHNHPSGDPSPSQEDREVTKRLVDCGKVLGVEVLDHIIIGDQRYTSLREHGIIP
ncbi:JAB domain-containing protein [Salicibibacter halophilus]|uniref:JAB domain-containing protein n=2 Tax=Salicibibacter halophilus TaxID=2502791 RepID=A0A514LN77_9BACI|nr:DNA repair protein RadC [Salicibibacter halophilus]QDI93045.1 JAB domain-containing protein [Salicibibacter halophilus]